MRALIVGVVGTVATVGLVRGARRNVVRDRVRAAGRFRIPVPEPARRAIAHGLDAAALDVPVDQAASLWAFGTAGSFVFGLALGGPSVGLGLAVAVGVGAPGVVYSLRHRRSRRVAGSVPEVLERVASELRAGGTIATALAGVAAGESALAPDFVRIETRRSLGAPTADVLRAWARERPAPGVDAAAGALTLCSSMGGQSADALDGLAWSLRERLAVAAEAHALAAQARTSAIVVGGAPLAYLAWSAVVDPHALHALVATGIGHSCLAVGLAFEALGLWWMRRIVASGAMP